MGETRLNGLLDRIREIAKRVANSQGLELVDLELHGRGPGAVLRIYLDKPAGVTHLDCQTVSRQVGTILDIEDVMPARYTLEVSSPGLDRRLANPVDYQRFAGQKVKFLLKTPYAGRGRLEGRLLGLEEGKVMVEIESIGRVEIALDDIERANLVPEWEKLLGSKAPPKRSNLR